MPLLSSAEPPANEVTSGALGGIGAGGIRCSAMKLSILPAAIALFLTIVMVAGSSHAATPQPDAGAGQGVVMLETEGSGGISVRMAEELARILNDGSRRRIITGNRHRITAEYCGP